MHREEAKMIIRWILSHQTKDARQTMDSLSTKKEDNNPEQLVFSAVVCFVNIELSTELNGHFVIFYDSLLTVTSLILRIIYELLSLQLSAY